MAGLSNLIPLIILLIVVGVGGFIGYGLYQWSNELAERANKKMEKKNMSFTKEGGIRVGVKAMPDESYADKTQKYVIKPFEAESSKSQLLTVSAVFSSTCGTMPHFQTTSRVWAGISHKRTRRRAVVAAQQRGPAQCGRARANRGQRRQAQRRSYRHQSREAVNNGAQARCLEAGNDESTFTTVENALQLGVMVY